MDERSGSVKEGLAAAEAGDFAKFEGLIADDFTMSGRPHTGWEA
jgi:hypothetical protein